MMTNNTPTFSHPKTYTKDQATKQLNDIFVGFLGQDRSKPAENIFIRTEAGSGKTRTCYKSIITFLCENPHLKEAAFLKAHENIYEFCLAANEEVAERKCQGKFVPEHLTFVHMKGIRAVCKTENHEHLENDGSRFCDECNKYHDLDSEYYNQYLDTDSMVRVYVHNHLQTEPGIDVDWRSHTNFCDEDPVATMTNPQDTLLILEDVDKPCEYETINNIIKAIGLSKDIQDDYKVLKNLAQAAPAKPLKLEYRNARLAWRTVKKLITASKLNKKPSLSDIRVMNELYTEESRLFKFKEMLRLIRKLSKSKLKKVKGLWVCFNRYPGDDPITHKPITPVAKLVYGKVKPILKDLSQTLCIMDATGVQSVVEAVLDRKFTWHSLPVEQQDKMKVVQVIGAFAKSDFFRTEYKKDANGNYILGDDGKRIFDYVDETWKVNHFLDYVDTMDTSRLGIITYNQIEGDTKFFFELDKKAFKQNGHINLKGHFGACRGLNRWSDNDCDTLMVIGQNTLPPETIFNLTQLIFGCDAYEGDKDDLLPNDYKSMMHWGPISKVFRMKKGPHKRTMQNEYKNPFCRDVARHFSLAETYQAIHRIRMIHGNEKKTVILFSDVVLDVSVDQVIDASRELYSVKNRKMMKYLCKHKFILDDLQVFMDVLDCDTFSGDSFRRKSKDPKTKGSYEWMLNHRDLRHWSYVGTNKKVKGKLFAWHDQTEDQVREWLQNQGFKLRSVTESL